jgi:hypothetical protein
LMGLRNLGLINMIATTLSIPIFFALYTAHRKADKVYGTLALIIFIIGATVYLANNTAFPMLSLSGKYADATTDAQRTLFVAAGEAMLAQAESHTPGSFLPRYPASQSLSSCSETGSSAKPPLMPE